MALSKQLVLPTAINVTIAAFILCDVSLCICVYILPYLKSAVWESDELPQLSRRKKQVIFLVMAGWCHTMARAQKLSGPVMLPAFPFYLQSLALWPGWDWSIETGNQGVRNLRVLCSRSDVWPGTGEVFWLVNPDEGNFTGFAGHCIC